MRRPYRAESLRWLTQAKDEFEDAEELRKSYPNGLPGGIPSRYFDDLREAEEAMQLAKNAIDLIEKKLEED